MLSLLKSKIHRACVTEADIDYVGSLSIDRLLMEKVGLLPYEKIDVYNITNGERFTTYAIPAPEGSGKIGANGAAVHKANVGDRVIICSYAEMTPQEASIHQPCIVVVDEKNHIVKG